MGSLISFLEIAVAVRLVGASEVLVWVNVLSFPQLMVTNIIVAIVTVL